MEVLYLKIQYNMLLHLAVIYIFYHLLFCVVKVLRKDEHKKSCFILPWKSDHHDWPSELYNEHSYIFCKPMLEGMLETF